MKAIKSIDLGKAAIYGAVLAAFWTLVFGIYYWVMGWAFGSASWLVDMNLGIWTEFTLETALSVVWRMLVNGLGGLIAGFFVALIYNGVAGIMGGILIELDDVK